jgi:hypothetical protein
MRGNDIDHCSSAEGIGCKEAGSEDLFVGWMGGDAREKGISLRLPPKAHKVTP